MAITYEFIFRDGGSGSTPTSSGTIPVNPGSQPGTSIPDLPQSPPKPPAGASQSGGVTAEEVQQIVNRAAERQAEQRPQTPASAGQGQGGGQGQQPVGQPGASQQQIVQPGQGSAPPTSPQQSTQPQRPAGEATLDAIRDAASRSGGQTVQQPVSSPVQSSGEPQQAPASPQLPTQPQQSAAQPTPQVVQQFITQHSAASTGQRALPEHPDLPSLKQPEPPLPPPTSPQPPTQPPLSQEAQMRQMISQLVGGAGGAVGLPGSGAAAAAIGASGPMALTMAGISGFGLALSQYNQSIDTMASYSPEVAQAQAQGEIMEEMRRLDRARKYGEEDASNKRIREAVWRQGKTFLEDVGRSFWRGRTGAADVGMWFEIFSNQIEELQRTMRGVQPMSPVQQFMSDFDHVPDPWPFSDNKGTTIHDSNEYGVVITGL